MLKKLETELKLRGFSEKTVSSYLFHNQKFLDFIEKQPDEITEDDVKSYLASLISDRKLKSSSVNLTLSALKFFYSDVLEKDIFRKIKPPKLEKNLPVVLSKEEVRSLIDAAKNQKHRLLVEFLYHLFSTLALQETGVNVTHEESAEFISVFLFEPICFPCLSRLLLHRF